MMAERIGVVAVHSVPIANIAYDDGAIYNAGTLTVSNSTLGDAVVRIEIGALLFGILRAFFLLLNLPLLRQ